MKTLKLILASFTLSAIVMAVPMVALANAGCPARIGTNQLGDGRMYSCYLSGEDANYCYYDCYPV
jgi:hypothetical protein